MIVNHFFGVLTIEQWLMSCVIESYNGLGGSCYLITFVENVEKVGLQKDLLRYAPPEEDQNDIHLQCPDFLILRPRDFL